MTRTERLLRQWAKEGSKPHGGAFAAIEAEAAMLLKRSRPPKVSRLKPTSSKVTRAVRKRMEVPELPK